MTCDLGIAAKQSRVLPAWCPDGLEAFAWVRAYRRRGWVIFQVPVGTYECRCGQIMVDTGNGRPGSRRAGICTVAVKPLDEHGSLPPGCPTCGEHLGEIMTRRVGDAHGQIMFDNAPW